MKVASDMSNWPENRERHTVLSTYNTVHQKRASSDAFVKYTDAALHVCLELAWISNTTLVCTSSTSWQVGHLYAWNVKDFPSPIDVPKLRKACDRLSDYWNNEIALWSGSFWIEKVRKIYWPYLGLGSCWDIGDIFDQYWCFSCFENFEKFCQKSRNLSVTNIARDRMLKLSNGTSMAFVANKVIWFHFATPSISINLY